MDEYDRRAEAWVRNHYPGASPDPGSVKFTTDCAAYASGGWANIEAEWTENGTGRGEVLAEEAWQYDLGQLIRELLEIELPGALPADSPQPGPGRGQGGDGAGGG